MYNIKIYIYTNLTYSSKTFGSFEVRKTSEPLDMCQSERSRLKDGEIACIVIFSFIFIVIICIILFFTVFKKKKYTKEEEKEICSSQNPRNLNTLHNVLI